MRMSLNVRTPTSRPLDLVCYTEDSTAVDRLAYEALEKNLTVYWRTGGETTVQNVSAREFQRIVNAKSTGRAVNRLIASK